MRVGYGVVTFNRPGNFLTPMVQSLQTSGYFDAPDLLPLHLSVGHFDSSHLGAYRENPKFKVWDMTPEETKAFRFDEISRGARCSLGHYWCMKKMLDDPSYDAVALFEDDVIFARGWVGRLERAVDALRRVHGNRWIMTLYLPDFNVDYHFKKGDLWFATEKTTFFGSQGILYPRAVAQEILPVLKTFVDQGRRATDMAVADYAISARVPLVAITPCLVEHIGNISVGCNPEAVNFHKAGCFKDPI